MLKRNSTFIMAIITFIVLAMCFFVVIAVVEHFAKEIDIVKVEYAERQKEWVYRIGELEELSEASDDRVKKLSNDLNKISEELTTMTELNKTLKNKLADQEKENKVLRERLKKQEVNRKQVSRGGSRNRKLLGTFTATAYGDNARCQGKWVGQTASGMKPQRGVIAVDPRVIPLGTKLYVEGYGNCIAGDTGGAIKGNKVDLFMNDASERKEFGRRKVKVYLR